MAQTIKLKRSATSGAVPTTSSLSLGEVAINTHDGKMYIKKDDGTASVVEVGGTTPSLSGSVTISEDNDGVQLTWSVSSDSVDYYEVWSSVGAANDFVLIGKVLASDLSGSTVSMTDSGYDTSSTTNYYKVFAIKNGLYSNALSASQTVSNTVSDPANMSVVPSTESFLVQYDLPDSPLLASVSIKKYAATTESAANNESAATTIFTGTRDSFAYAVPAADVSKYHKFWVVSNTRT